MRAKGRTMIATLLCAFLAGASVSPVAFAQSRGNSGLPADAGNPIAKLQQDIVALQQRVANLNTQIGALTQLGQDVGWLKTQVAGLQQVQQGLATLQGQVAPLAGLPQTVGTLQGQVSSFNNQVTGLNTQVTTLKNQLAALGTSDPLAVYDSKGTKVGDVVGVQESVPWVAIMAQGYAFALQVYPDQLTGDTLWFQGANCTGATFIEGVFNNVTHVSSAASLAAVEPNSDVYVTAAGAPLQNVGVTSVRQNGQCVNFWGVFTIPAVAATKLMSLSALYTPPYNVH